MTQACCRISSPVAESSSLPGAAGTVPDSKVVDVVGHVACRTCPRDLAFAGDLALSPSAAHGWSESAQLHLQPSPIGVIHTLTAS